MTPMIPRRYHVFTGVPAEKNVIHFGGDWDGLDIIPVSSSVGLFVFTRFGTSSNGGSHAGDWGRYPNSDLDTIVAGSWLDSAYFQKRPTSQGITTDYLYRKVRETHVGS